MAPKGQTLKELVPVTPRGEATRRKLLEAAGQEFAAQGFHAASVSSITTRAGVGQGTFYLYFHSKDEIFATVVRELCRQLRRTLVRAAAAGADRDQAERLSLQAFLEFARTQPGSYRVVQEAQFVDQAVFRECYEELARSYGDSLRAAALRGGADGADDEVRTWAMLGIAHFLGLRFGLWQGRVPEAAAVEAAARAGSAAGAVQA
jgi:AcrR family transcriptional regulator